MSFACFAFNGTQAVFVAYCVTYMIAQGHPLVAAGSLYSTVIAVAVPGRILWAWVGGFYVAPHLVLGGLAFGMAVSIGLIGAFTPHWPSLAIGAVTMVVAAKRVRASKDKRTKTMSDRRQPALLLPGIWWSKEGVADAQSRLPTDPRSRARSQSR